MNTDIMNTDSSRPHPGVLPGEHLHTQVELDITVKSGGTAQNTVYYGSFQSGPGKFHGFPFDGLSGKFRNYYHTLEFYDADIAFGDMHIHTLFQPASDRAAAAEFGVVRVGTEDENTVRKHQISPL